MENNGFRTKDNLEKRGINQDVSCPFCNIDKEFILSIVMWQKFFFWHNRNKRWIQVNLAQRYNNTIVLFGFSISTSSCFYSSCSAYLGYYLAIQKLHRYWKENMAQTRALLIHEMMLVVRNRISNHMAATNVEDHTCGAYL